MSTAVEVLRNPVARHHLGGMAVNALGGSVFDIAIAVLVLQQTGSVWAMGSIVIMESIPTIFPGILIGAVVDRNAPRRMIGVGYGGQAIIVGLTAVALLLTGTTSLIVIAALVFIRMSFDMFARAGTFAAVPSMYGELSPSFNSLFRLTWTSISIVGPVAGGILAATISPVWLIAADALSFAVMWAVMMRLPLPRQPLGGDENVPLLAAIAGSAKAFRQLRGSNRFLWAVILDEIALAPALPVALFAISAVYHKGSAEIGLANAALGVGLVLGSAAITVFVSRDTRKLMLGSAAVSSIGLIAMLIPDWRTTSLGLLAIYAGGIASAVASSNLLQKVMPESELGKVLTTMMAIETIFGAMSIFLISALVSHVSLTAGYFAMIAAAIASIVALTWLGSERWMEKAIDPLARNTIQSGN